MLKEESFSVKKGEFVAIIGHSGIGKSTIMKILMKYLNEYENLLKEWDYKKHAKLVGTIYLTCFAIDMTLGYLLVKKTFDENGDPKPLKKA